MAKTIGKMTPITEEEIDSLSSARGARNYKWSFPEKLFNGEWWAIEVPNNDVSSALNSYRNQSEAVYGTRATIRKLSDGRLGVRRLVDKPVEPEDKK